MSVMPGYPVPRAQWATSGEACTACGKRFSFFTSKENCPCCGRLFCSACLSAECTLTPMGLPTAICLECFQKIQDWRRSNRVQRKEMEVGSPTQPIDTTTAAASAADVQLAALEKDFDRLRETGRQLREENGSLVDLLAAKDACIAQLTEDQLKSTAAAVASTRSSEEVQQQLRSVTGANAETTKALSEVQQKLSASQEANESLMERMNTLLETNATLKARVAELEEAAAQGQSRSTKDIEELQRRCDAATAAAAESKTAAQAAKDTMQVAAEEKAQLQQQYDTAVAHARDVDAQLQSLRTAQQTSQTVEATLRDEVEALRAAAEAAKSDLRKFQEEQQNSASAAQSTAASQMAAQQQEVSSLRDQLETITSRAQELEAAKSSLEEKRSETQRASAEAISRHELLLEEVRSLHAAEQEKWAAANARDAERLLTLQSSLDRLTSEAAEAQEQLQSASTETQSHFSSQLAEKQALIDALTKQVEELQNANAALQAEKENMERQLRDEQKGKKAAEDRVAALQGEVDAHTTVTATWETERSARDAEIYQLKAALFKADKQLTSLQQQQREWQEQQSSAHTNLQSSTAAQLSERQRKIDALTEQLNTMRPIVKELQDERNTATEEVQRVRHSLSEAEQRAAALHDEVQRLQAENKTRTADAATMLAAKTQELEGALASARSSADAQALEKQRVIDGLTAQLEASDKEVAALTAKAARSEEDVAALRSQLRQLEMDGGAQVAAARAEAAEDARRESSNHASANAQLSAQLRDKEVEVAELQRSSFEAAKVAKDEVHALRQQWAAAKQTYAAEREAWQASLTELRLALTELAAKQSSDLLAKDAASAPPAETNAPLLSSSSPAAAEATAGGSRWSRPTRIEAVCLPRDSVQPESIPAVAGLEQWEFDTKAEAARAAVPDTLVRIGYQIALDWLLFPNSDAMRRWVNMLNAVQLNYRPNPYHNKVHAADILQGVFALVSACPGLLAHMTLMEKRAIVFAAAVHDVRHPGRTEAFLKNTFDATYFDYNGCHVLEQMHTATAFHLLGNAELDFTANVMDDADALRFHDLVASVIAGTFMGSHHALMQTWSRPLREGTAYDFAKDADRHAVLGMFLHAADIGAQSRGVPVALKWLDVVDEMYEQGDEESARGLPVCPGNGRGGDIKKGQLFFMEMFVIPTFDLVHQLFPAMDGPLRNLRALHAHYCDALQDTARPFPQPVAYNAARVAEAKAAAAAAADAEQHQAALRKREEKLTRKERTLEQAVQRLREATATVAQREAQLTDREAQLSTKQAELTAASAALTAQRQTSTTEAELLRAVNAVVQREEAVRRQAAEVAATAAELEQREAVTSQLSVQLATIAERVNRRRQLLRYREAKLRLRETTPRDGSAADAPSQPAPEELERDARRPSTSPVRTVEMIKLQSALNKLNSAMSFM